MQLLLADNSIVPISIRHSKGVHFTKSLIAMAIFWVYLGPKYFIMKSQKVILINTDQGSDALHDTKYQDIVNHF